MSTTEKEGKKTAQAGPTASENETASPLSARPRSLRGLTIRRVYSDPSVSPYEAVEWELRTAAITSEKGETIFEQKNVEVPRSWSQTSTNIVAQKYFHGRIGMPERESSVRQLIERVAATITGYGEKGGYFATAADRDAFHDELAAILVNQVASFNSPVWFNVGIEEKPQASACFINSCGDSMASILTLAKTEGMLFKYGSGTGSNLSSLRGSREGLSSGGTASGPLSFMKGFDSFAGAIKSGGKTRRAAKMVILNIDHPDIEDFILSKASEEKKAWALIDAGYDGSFNGEAYSSIFYQNANHSIRVTDEFMEAVEKDGEWWTKEVLTGAPHEKYKARDLMSKISEAAWVCGDPGMQYDTTINRWNPVKTTNRINASNPCFPGDQRVATDKGFIAFRELIERVNRGEEFKVWTHRATAGANGAEGNPEAGLILSSPTQYMVTGVNDVYRVVFDDGVEIRATKNHRFWTVNRGYVAIEELLPSDRVLLADAAIPATAAEKSLPISSDWMDYREGSDRLRPMTLPSEWSAEFGELLGHLIGDGSVGETMLSWIYGTPEDAAELMPRHRELLRMYVGAGSVNECVQANGTKQLRVTRGPFRRFLAALGVGKKRAHEKRVPASLFQAPPAAQVGFLRGLFGADGCIVNQEAKGTRYAGLGSRSLGLVQDVQKLLLLFGVQSTIYVNENARSSFDYTTVGGEDRTYAGRPVSYDLRISGPSLERFARTIGFSLPRKEEKAKIVVQEHVFYREDPTTSIVDVIYEGPEVTYNLTEPLHHSYVVEGIVVANCSEYMFVDDSACNLASLNLIKFFKMEDGSFDVDNFRHACDIVISAQEMLVDNASYPTAAIAENSHKFRPLGLGYANLGALLMATGHAYDSDEGRAYAAAITSLMCGEAYLQSSKIAAEMGPFAAYAPNRDAFLGVIEMHRDAAHKVPNKGVPADLAKSHKAVWDASLESGRQFGYKNGQVTVLAPTGTIGFMMDCDTTGVEPDLALVKYKKLVGGGTIKIVNNTVPLALKRLGYDEQEIDEIVKYVDEKGTIEGAPGFQPEHLTVFDCAFRALNGTRSIHYMGHVKMMEAVQPFLSGAISKTVNLPPDATPEEIAGVYMEGWKRGLKAIAIYRDGCKRTQPLNTAASMSDSKSPEKRTSLEYVGKAVSPTSAPFRRKLPDERRAITHKFSVAGHEGYVTVGLYEDGKPGEIFLTMSKEGSTISGLMDSFATAVSLTLQYGVPLEALVDKFTHMRFEPAGFTKNPEIPMAKSLVDYIFKWLASKFLSAEEKHAVGVISRNTTSMSGGPGAPEPPGVAPVAVTEQEVASRASSNATSGGGSKLTFETSTDAPACQECGSIMVRSAACYKCMNCGATSGCS
jgi:ribonucleoside-diphosphate reductase alpha chain